MSEFSWPHILYDPKKGNLVEVSERLLCLINTLLLPAPPPPWDHVGTNVLAQWVEKESQNSEA